MCFVINHQNPLRGLDRFHIYTCTSGSGTRGGPGPPGRSAGVRTKEVRESRGDPGPLEGGGPGLRLLVLSIPPWGTHGDAGSLPEQGTGPGP